MFRIIIFFTCTFYLFLSEANVCRLVEDSYQSYFINGVGNDDRSVNDSTLELHHVLSNEFTELRNPRNNELYDFLHTKLGTPFTWDEIKEVSAQKIQEKKDYLYIVDEVTVKSMFDLLSKDKVNIVIAHSQGNLYANELCKYNNGRKKQKNIGIASPAAVVECGNNTDYVTAYNDLVINALRIFSGIDYRQKSPLKANSSAFGDCDDFVCHGLVEFYLRKPELFKKITTLYQNKIEQVKNEELNFDLVNIKLTQISNKEKSILTNSREYLDETYSSLNLTVRRNIASFKTVSYITDLYKSNFMTSLLKLNFASLRKKDFEKILNTPINVESDREYADVIGYILDSIYPYCLKNRKNLPKNLVNICESYVIYYSPKQYTENVLFDKFSLRAKDMDWSVKEKSLSINCLKFLERKDIQNTTTPVSLKYIPQDSISTIKANDFEFNVYERNFLNKKEESQDILSINFYKENDEFKFRIKKLSDDVNKVEKPISSEYSKCNSIAKLISNNCKNYLMGLMSYK